MKIKLFITQLLFSFTTISKTTPLFPTSSSIIILPFLAIMLITSYNIKLTTDYLVLLCTFELLSSEDDLVELVFVTREGVDAFLV